MTDSQPTRLTPTSQAHLSCEEWMGKVQESVTRDSSRLFGVGKTGKVTATYLGRVQLESTEGESFECTVTKLDEGGLPHLTKTAISEGSDQSRPHLLSEVRAVVDAVLTDRIDEGAATLLSLGPLLGSVPQFDGTTQMEGLEAHLTEDRLWRTFYATKTDMVKEAVGEQTALPEPKFPAFYNGAWSKGEIYRHSGVLEDSWKTLVGNVADLLREGTKSLAVIQGAKTDPTLVEFGKDLVLDLKGLSEALDNMNTEVHDPSILAQGYDVMIRRLREYEHATRFLNQLAAGCAVVNQ